ncbi:porin family protein [Jannaschia formosa]|uniref:porin family protein n=1 Tax=Jannaschia formosa TaxID=2259592 RepID=UPI000E1BBCC2|nr:porin family protein [Jannaschia formosa]TFL18260.1 DUF560 domain-containing protein [Jannaschia formosa]
MIPARTPRGALRRLGALGLALLLCVAPMAQAQEAADPRWVEAGELVRAGRPAEALPLLEMLVADAPDNAPYRLELAAVLLRLGQGQRARFHLARARGGALPDDVRETVNGLLAGLPLRTTWERSLSFAFRPESNPARGSTGFILVNGVPVEVGTAGAGEPGRSFTVTAEGGRQWALSPRRALFAAGSVEHVARSGKLEDTTVLRARGGLRTVVGATKVEAALRWSEILVEDTALAQGPGVTASLARPLGRHGDGYVSAWLDRLTYGDLPGLDGTDSGASIGYAYALSPSTRLSFALGYARRNARAEGSRLTTVNQAIGIDHSFRGGLSVGGTLTRTRSWRDAATGFFTVVQKDTRDTVALRASHSRLNVMGFAPVAEIARERQDSTIPLLRYENDRASISFTRRF